VVWWLWSGWLALAVLFTSHMLVLYPTLVANSGWLGPVVRGFRPNGNEVWLTIDDGPHESDTKAILETLALHGARATFFVKGTNVRANPHLVDLITRSGSTVANHSDTHPSGTFWCLGPTRIAAEINGCNEAIAARTGTMPPWFRAPVGMKNPFVHPLLDRRGMKLIGWSARAFDAVASNADGVVKRITAEAEPGAIILLHQGKPIHAECIRRVVEELSAKGFRFVVPADDQLAGGRLKTKR